jgi:ABC-2 type transport system ATP-binding protein
MEARVEPKDISLRRPTLDEVFIHLTGATAPYQNEEANS